MKACVLRRCGPITDRPLSFEGVERPTPGPGESLIRVRACGVCRTDLHVIEGELDQSKQKTPLIPGHQVVGEIVESASDPSSSSPLQGERSGGGAPRTDVARDENHTNSSRSDPPPNPLPEREGELEPDPILGREGELAPGTRVGVAWLHGTCGACRFCTAERENLCPNAQFTGWMRDGGYAEFLVARSDFVYPIPAGLDDHQVAPLLCAGIIGYRCLRRTGIEEWPGARIGIYGFGAAGHLAIQLARHRGAEVYVCTRDERHQRLAEEMGATWVGGTMDAPPVPLDAAIIFAPAGEIVPPALRALDRGGRVVCGGIHMSPITEINYQDLYWERELVSVANNTRADGQAFLREAAEANVKTHVETFPLNEANDALIKLKTDAIRGAAVLVLDV